MDVPIPQSEEYFISLRKLGVSRHDNPLASGLHSSKSASKTCGQVPCVFVRYPREGHGIAEPRHVHDYRQRHVQWFDKFIKGEADSFVGRL